MRALMELVEADRRIVRTAELSAVAPEVLVAARKRRTRSSSCPRRVT
jgi:hypothetical protein